MSAILERDSRAKALIFDLDGTLIDNMPIHYRAWQRVAEEKGFEYPEELFYELAGIPTIKIVPLMNERLGINLEPEETTALKEKYFLEMIGEIPLIEETVSIVRTCHGKIPMSVGTGSRKEIAEKVLAATGLYNYFEIVITADDVANHKPAPDTFLRCAEAMGVEPRNCQVFEDGEQGLAAARSAGMIATDVRPFLKK